MKKNIQNIFLFFLITINSLQAQQQKNKYVGVGYSVWFSNFHGNTKYYHDKTRNPDGIFGHFGIAHWWGDPKISGTENDYLLMHDNNPDKPNHKIIDNHANLLKEAGVDFIGLDLTNGNHDLIVKEAKAVCLRYTQRLNNVPVLKSPQIAFFARGKEGIDLFIDEVWNNPKYSKDIFFKYDGKPLILLNDPNNELSLLKEDKYKLFTIQKMWGLLKDTNKLWSYKQNVEGNRSQGFYSYNNWPEEMSVCAATQGNYVYNDLNPELTFGRKGRANSAYWDNQWTHVNNTNPSVLFIWSWNEWVSQNLAAEHDKGIFTDVYKYEYSADLEPDTEHGDLWYKKLKEEVRKYKTIVPNITLRDVNSGTWYFKYFIEEQPNNNQQLKRNFTQKFNWASGKHYQMITGDFNNDGFNDIGLRNTNTGLIHLTHKYKNLFHFNNNENVKWVSGDHYQIFTGDFNNDGMTDIGMRDSNNGVWYFRLKAGQNDYSYPVQKTFKWITGSHYQPIVGDFNNDGVTDIGMRDSANGIWYFRLKSQNYDDYTFPIQKTFKWAVGSHYQPFAAQCNLEDNFIDIGMRNPDTGDIYIRLGNENLDYNTNQQIFKGKSGNNYDISMFDVKEFMPNQRSKDFNNSSGYLEFENTFDESDFNVYPNPSSTEINLSGLTNDLKTLVYIYDIKGRLILETYEALNIDISKLKPGIYIVKTNYNSLHTTFVKL